MTDPGGARLAATLVALFAVGLLLWFVGAVAEIVLLLFIAVLMGTALSSLTDLIGRYTRAPRGVALTIAALAGGLGVAGLGFLIVPPVITQTQELVATIPDYGVRLEGTIRRLAVRYPMLESLASGAGTTTPLVERLIADATGFVQTSLVPYLTAGGKLAVELFSVIAMAIFLARDPKSYADGLISITPPRARHITRAMLDDLANTIRAWIGAQLFAMFVLAVLTAVGLWILRVPYALSFGVFTGAVAVVPFFGTIVSTILPALFVVVTAGLGKAAAVALLGVVVHLVEANVVAPLIFQEQIKLPPVLTILSVLIMAQILGVLGLIVAVPMLASMIVVVRHVLIAEVYGETGQSRRPAVLVPTQEFRRASGSAPKLSG